ncbi:hypothetical protein ACFL3G_01000 [Planctomycetota bacterium]
MKYKYYFFAVVIGMLMFFGGCKKQSPEVEESGTAAESVKTEAKVDPEFIAEQEKKMEELREKLKAMQKEVEADKKNE